MPFPTAAQHRLEQLFHWQRFDADRLERILTNNTVYCSRPSDFNDPWDCRPYFNAGQLDDPTEMQKHIDWAVRICRRDGRMSEPDIARMQVQLRDRNIAAELIGRITVETQRAVLNRYRVYCLGPDVGNQLMWAHYADSHRGICLEFNVMNDVICCALEVQYFAEFPMTRPYSGDLAENLLPLLAKSDVWKYEREYRLVAQDAANATAHETLFAVDGFLKLPEGALQAIIVGCEGDYAAVRDVVRKCRSEISLKRATKVDNRYALEITA